MAETPRSLRELVKEDLTARGCSSDVIEHWPTYADRFELTCGLKAKYERADVIKYVAWQREQGFAQSTINQQLRAIKLLAQIQEWDFPKLKMPKIKPQDVTRTIFNREQVISMIQMGRQLLIPEELSYLALSTTYGLRREEMSILSPEDITPEGITIKTVKNGPITTQLVPGEIRPYLDAFKPYSPDYLSHIFQRIITKLGIKVGLGYGWHSIRRSLVTELIIADASALNVFRFMRWADASTKGEFGMLSIYAQRDQGHIDRQIFEIHPFLPYWRK